MLSASIKPEFVGWCQIWAPATEWWWQTSSPSLLHRKHFIGARQGTMKTNKGSAVMKDWGGRRKIPQYWANIFHEWRSNHGRCLHLVFGNTHYSSHHKPNPFHTAPWTYIAWGFPLKKTPFGNSTACGTIRS